MGWSDATSTSSLTAATAAALFTAVLCPHQSDGYTPVLAELICWTLVVAIFELLLRISPDSWKSHGALFTPSLMYLYWAAAVSIAFAAVLSSFVNSLWVTYYDRLDGRERSGTFHAVSSIALRAIGLLAIVGIVLKGMRPGSTLAVTNAALAGGLKAAHWIVVFYLAEEMPWETAPTIWAYVASLAGSSTPGIDGSLGIVLSFFRMVVVVLSVGQIVDFIPKTEKSRRLLGVFILWPLLSLVHHKLLSSHSPSLPGVAWLQLPDQSPHHPIELIIRKAQQDFDRLVNQQSKTLQSAEAEYRKRYSRNPPPGFDKWFSYAQSKQSVLIDDFDMINEDLKPFWKIAPQRLRESVDHVSSFDHLALRKCGFTDGQYHGQGGGWIVEDLGKLLEDVSKDIPNVDFAFDVVDEPRVVITRHMLDIGGVSKPEFQDANHKSIWDRTTGPCAHITLSDNTATVHDYGLLFVQDWKRAKDVCSHPEFGLMHGFFSSPMTCMLTDAPIPVLSQSAPTSFGDIMYPSPWYPEKMDQGDYKNEEDPLWDQKAKNLYWAGSTTGSYSWNSSWQYAHRQRFVKMIQTLNHTNHMYLKEFQPGKWASYKEIEDHSDLFDVKLTAIIQCDDKDCEEQEEFFALGEKEDRSQQFHSQFIFDTDGNSFSGRFYTLLQSRSAVLKQTVLREWHDERLIPWIHFIPVSLSMNELPELMRYMTSHEDGSKRAKEIAEAGREWHGKVLRKEDFTIYLYRLMLELARIMDPAREVEN
ncbi:glycosyltransferase family 90 protein [Stemphylium lycopersici]|uniref:Glycosyltransferase family 90 protein n=1 Tax=Stemphylium lycopersici TaxID=183478 RepID=A0A364NCG8_STELY|nr:glycosyltransferase family 90 protein [Stemphylium lycopersici]RAR14853.1 glycosyltransferase family 90 protein [Stemphylium lycopersici]